MADVEQYGGRAASRLLRHIQVRGNQYAWQALENYLLDAIPGPEDPADASCVQVGWRTEDIRPERMRQFTTEFGTGCIYLRGRARMAYPGQGLLSTVLEIVQDRVFACGGIGRPKRANLLLYGCSEAAQRNRGAGNDHCEHVHRPRIMSCCMRPDYAVLLLAAAAFSAAQGADLFRDDFAHFPPGWLTNPVGLLNAAIQEYHYVASRGVPLGAWENAISHLDAWIAGDEAGKPYLEQQLDSRANQFSNPIFLTGDSEWADYTVEAKIKPLLLNGTAGVVFRYHTNRHYYVFGLSDGRSARLLMHEPIEDTFRVPKWRELATADFNYDVKRYYTLRVENEGPRIRASIDGRVVLEASDNEILRGKAGITASMPAAFSGFLRRHHAGEYGGDF